MGTKMVRIDEDLYERIKAHKQDDESFSDVIDRLVDDWSLLDFDTGRSHEEIEHHKELLGQAEETSKQDTEETLERMGIDTE